MYLMFLFTMILHLDFTGAVLTDANYQAVRLNGPVLCALETPDVTNSIRSQLECSEQCSQDTSCSSFNFKKADGVKPTCERFNVCYPRNISVMPGCAHYRKQFFPFSDPCKILVQQRVDGSTSFSRTWNEYKAGFGEVNCNYWLGNEQLYQLTQNRSYKLRVELQSRDNLRWYLAEYSTFRVASEALSYQLTVGGVTTGNVSWSALTDVTYGNNGMKFTTVDRDNDRVSWNCAVGVGDGGGWWYNDCGYSYLNIDYNDIRWSYLFGNAYNLQTSRMWLVCP